MLILSQQNHYLKILLALFLWACLGLPATAHEGRPLYIEVEGGSAGLFTMRWKIPPVMADDDLPIISLVGSDCQLVGKQQGYQAVGRLTGIVSYHCASGAVPSIELTYPGINPVLSTLVRYESVSGAHYSLLHGPDVVLIALPEYQNWTKVVGDYTATGTDHILSGYDHLAFVLCLMLLARAPRRIFYTVTGFTLGHSLTLGIVTFAGVTLSPVLVESLIAFSIVILAAELARGGGRTLAYKYPVLVAGMFGLLHGLGFAGALAELGLPQGMKITALAFFNVGVEIGQIAFVSLIYALFWLTAHLSKGAVLQYTAKLQYVLLLSIGCLSSFWTIERIMA
jgi:hypothetical protein